MMRTHLAINSIEGPILHEDPVDPYQGACAIRPVAAMNKHWLIALIVYSRHERNDLFVSWRSHPQRNVHILDTESIHHLLLMFGAFTVQSQVDNGFHTLSG